MTTGLLQLFPVAALQYCEANGLGWIAEPVNAMTGLVFVAVAAQGFRVWQRHGRGDMLGLFAIGSVLMIGVGAFFFHAARTPLGLMLDVVPIALFTLAIFAMILLRAFGQSAAATMAHLAGFTALTVMVMMILAPRAFSVGAWYIVPLFLLYALGVWLVLRARLHMHNNSDLRGEAAATSDQAAFRDVKMGYALVLTGVLMAAGLVVRAYDLPTCGILPFGLHAAWHVLVAGACYVLMTAAIRYLPAGAGSLMSRA